MAEPEYFTLAELRALPDMNEATKYTEALCLAAASYIVGVIEREVETSFIAREVTDEVHDGGVTTILLDRPWVLSVTSATEDGAAVTDTLSVSSSGLLRRVSGDSLARWAPGFGNVLVTYEAGYSATVPADIKQQALAGTRAHLLASAADSSMNARRTSLNTDMGVIQYVVAGEDRPTGYPELDATILSWRKRLTGPGAA